MATLRELNHNLKVHNDSIAIRLDMLVNSVTAEATPLILNNARTYVKLLHEKIALEEVIATMEKEVKQERANLEKRKTDLLQQLDDQIEIVKYYLGRGESTSFEYADLVVLGDEMKEVNTKLQKLQC